MRLLNHKCVRLAFATLLAVSGFANAAAHAGEEGEIRPGVYSGYVGGNISGVAADGSGLSAYYLNAVLNYESNKVRNGVCLEYATGEPVGTGNNQKLFFLDRTEFASSKGRIIPFADLYYYQNPEEGYKSRLAAGPGVGFVSADAKRIKSREDLFIYADQDELTRTLNTVVTRALLGARQNFKFVLTRRAALDGNLWYLNATDNLTDYSVNFDAELSAVVSKSLSVQLRWDEKYRHLAPLRSSPLTSGSLELMLLYTF
ncbi:MAG: DUF481 domain-containing protein [Nitrospinae bacterium]|nr:DUF481 domain-containing protein [Nitrospinota bacterium]